MNINLHNYEEFFLLYADNELSAEEKQAVERFVEAHPDLQAELEMIQQTIMTPGNEVFFNDKESLFRTTDTNSLVNLTNYESYFVQYTDDELNNEEKAATELFVYKHPECQEEFELIQKTRLEPDTHIQFPDKNLLYRNARESRPVIAIWIRYAAAAIILLLAGLFWLQRNQSTSSLPAQPLAQQKPAPVAKDPVQEPVAAEQQAVAENLSPKMKKATEPAHQLSSIPTPKIRPIENQKSETPVAAPNELLASQDDHRIRPVEIKPLASNDLPAEKITVPVVEDKPAANAPIFARQAEKEDYIYVASEPSGTKKPLRGLLRKASRFVEQNNPLSSEHKKGGVFTASNEQ